jgi:Flp pilus assembly protein TadD
VHLCDHGWALIDAGRPGEAAAPLRRAIALAPGKTMAEKNLAYLERLIEKRLGDSPESPTS